MILYIISVHHSQPNWCTISIREIKDGGREEGRNESVLEDSDDRSASRWCCKVDWFVHTSMPRDEWLEFFPLQVQRRKRTILHTSRTAGMRMMISNHFLLMVECLLPALMPAAQSTKFWTWDNLLHLNCQKIEMQWRYKQVELEFYCKIPRTNSRLHKPIKPVRLKDYVPLA